MKPATKLALRRWALRMLAGLVWRLDEWVHAQQMRLREETGDLRDVGDQVEALVSPAIPTYGIRLPGDSQVAPPRQSIHSVEKWRDHSRASAAGIQPIHRKKIDRTKRRMTAAEFDLQFQMGE